MTSGDSRSTRTARSSSFATPAAEHRANPRGNAQVVATTKSDPGCSGCVLISLGLDPGPLRSERGTRGDGLLRDGGQMRTDGAASKVSGRPSIRPHMPMSERVGPRLGPTLGAGVQSRT